MSRVGNAPILYQMVVIIGENNIVTVKGPKENLLGISFDITITLKDNELTVTRKTILKNKNKFTEQFVQYLIIW